MFGSGKSSILAALLGEMNKVHGRVCVSGNIGYVPQTAWIMNTTLKENILFGRDFDKNLYDRVIEACALKQDLGKLKNGRHCVIKTQNLSIDMLPARDQTEIGEKVCIVEMSFINPFRSATREPVAKKSFSAYL
jgi:ATP-binding cassette subfamily C (CFTR/MRP) protein 1